MSTLSADLLQHILRVFVIEHASSSGPRWTTQAIHIEYDRRLDIPSVIEEIEALQAKLDATADGDEKRALEEDVTGKILWLCWCGICAEVDQLLPKVVDYIRREGNMNGLREIFMIIFPMKLIDSDDNQTHLRRVMLDAGVGTSKHRLWLAAQAAEQAKWSGATRDIVALDNEGPIPSTSTHPPSTSVV
ncbi:hypothetical protein F5J12DRAFT_574420 [Pisolithus orientalis]|uniref:uncharacterized protein n=1 Tax=Pisolithus orientalis TaxID=936130 RepID=UPI0022241AEE|nr:uncharacterized protein F5J12DRAFT_574420 [Pisolithus orientalis]KAI5986975.1 hypothetical protein F5J12DRAFT_574420 [Pisolithus orientalis]